MDRTQANYLPASYRWDAWERQTGTQTEFGRDMSVIQSGDKLGTDEVL